MHFEYLPYGMSYPAATYTYCTIHPCLYCTRCNTVQNCKLHISWVDNSLLLNPIWHIPLPLRAVDWRKAIEIQFLCLQQLTQSLPLETHFFTSPANFNGNRKATLNSIVKYPLLGSYTQNQVRLLYRVYREIRSNVFLAYVHIYASPCYWCSYSVHK